jgi:hypothetical protein
LPALEVDTFLQEWLRESERRVGGREGVWEREGERERRREEGREVKCCCSFLADVKTECDRRETADGRDDGRQTANNSWSYAFGLSCIFVSGVVFSVFVCKSCFELRVFCCRGAVLVEL